MISYLEFGWENRPSKTGIKDGSPPAWFSRKIWDHNPALKQLTSGSDISKYISDHIHNNEIKLDRVELDPYARHTDFIRIGGIKGYVINQKVRTLLEDFHLPPHIFIPVIFYQKNKKSKQTQKVENYYWFYFKLETGENNVDFSQSIFYDYQHKIRYPNHDFSVESYQKYESIFVNTPPALVAERLVFNPSFDKELDFWGTHLLSMRDYVSQRLLNAFIEAGISGYLVKQPACELIFR